MRAAREQVAGLYALAGLAGDAERRQLLNGLLEPNAFQFRAEDCTLSPAVRCRHHSWHGY
jgi:hypothetical protein